MTTRSRYDRDARLYLRYWAPVLAPSAARLLDECDSLVGRLAAGATILDVGTGTGALAVDAAIRWPHVAVTGIDASSGMLDVARKRVATEAAGRVRLARAEADRLPLPDASVDLAVSSYVMQLVPDRRAALTEVLRVLRPGAGFRFVTWLDRGDPFLPDEEFDEAVIDLDVDEPDDGPGDRSGDFDSPEAAIDELMAAGYADASAEAAELTFDWTLESYLEYKLCYRETALISLLSRDERVRLGDLARARLERLAADSFTFRAPIVYASGRRPAA